MNPGKQARNDASEGAGTPSCAGSEQRRGGFLLASVGFATMTGFRDALAPFDVHPRQFAILRALAECDGRSQRQVSSALHIPPSRLVSLVDGLEERGFVRRGPHPTDRRTRLLYLTEAGRRNVEKLLSVAAEYEQTLLSPLTTAEQAQLNSLLGKVAGGFGLRPNEHPGMRG